MGNQNITTERCSSKVYRLILNGRIIGFAMLLANGRWSYTDDNGNQIGRATYSSPRDVAAAAEGMTPNSSAGRDQPTYDDDNGLEP